MARTETISVESRNVGILEYIQNFLGTHRPPDRTRDVISELTPNFIKNWRNKIRNFFSFGSGGKEK